MLLIEICKQIEKGTGVNLVLEMNRIKIEEKDFASKTSSKSAANLLMKIWSTGTPHATKNCGICKHFYKEP